MGWDVLVDGDPRQDPLQVLVGMGWVAGEVVLGLCGVRGEEAGNRASGCLPVEHDGGGVPFCGEDCGHPVSKDNVGSNISDGVLFWGSDTVMCCYPYPFPTPHGTPPFFPPVS
jgi:hypothetical protein